MSNEFLTDEDMHAFDEPSEEEKEINKLKKRIINDEEKIEIEETVLDNILIRVQTEIRANIKKTRMTSSAPLIKSYREQLLLLRYLESQLKIYSDFKEKRNEK